MKEKPVITGYCLIQDQQVFLSGNLLFSSNEKQPGAFFTEVYKNFTLNYPKFYKMDNLCKLGFLASEFLLKDKEIATRYPGDDIGIMLYNAASSLDTDRNHQQSIHDRSAYFPSPSVFVYTLANIVIGEICIRHKIFGEGTFFVEERFSPVLMHEYVSRLFQDEIVQCCITGWVELNENNYRGALYLVEKTGPGKEGIAIFEPQIIEDIYLQRR
ncbi:MAG: hypothetical protein R6X09_11300 [Bacteroidales bacterium]